ncbi:MAM and LDL-receptor class A domain-containing protein 1-like [Macrobrachium rosenbergii]|uniref:MAM and LDL-receptor class A domain-containing protein 1-like n=1 Tax=Macrobrachium rosenbergii TaxID=79674 RepID=UPI0034D6EE2C
MKRTTWVVAFLTSLLGGVAAGNQTVSTTGKPQHRLNDSRHGKQLGEVNGLCDFGIANDVTWCQWQSPGPNAISRSNSQVAITSWTLSTGANALWVGGPMNDTSGDDRGGYAFHETSSAPGQQAQIAVMESNVQAPTGATGKCLKFWYSVDGLSATELRVKVKGIDSEDLINIWETRDQTRGDWKEAQALYTFTDNHTLVVEAIPASDVDPFNIFRGHIAIDDLGLRPGQECIGLCSFEGGMCDWNNAQGDDFDWDLSRGAQKLTGPQRDRSSSKGNGLGGAFVYIDSSFPRRPEDFARLESIEFQETDPNNPPCMRFYTYMSGKGVGILRVVLQDVVTRQERVLWALAGNQGSHWILAQLPLSSNSPFKVIFEGTIGIPRLGDIAIDDITIVSGPCATLPAEASPPTSGDCTFEEDTCGWSNPSLRHRLDDVDFLRVRATEYVFPANDHTTGNQQGFYMALESPEKKLEGDRAWLISPTMKGQRQVKCLSFWYLMFEPLTDMVEPNLGSLSAFLKREDDAGSIILTPIWALQNFQGLTWYFGQAPIRADGDFQVVFEGVWGSDKSRGTIAIDDVSIFEGNCPSVPDAAVVRAGDCTFTRGSCGWRNLTSDTDFYWSSASPLRRPVNMNDHTYGSPVGYIYFDVFNLNSRSQKLQLVSPVMEPSLDRTPFCFTFWFAGFGADTNTSLSLFQRPAKEDNNRLINDLNDDILIWRHQPVRERASGWQFGQVPLVSGTRFQIVIEGVSYNGGFTLDDFKVYNGGCAKRPRDPIFNNRI